MLELKIESKLYGPITTPDTLRQIEMLVIMKNNLDDILFHLEKIEGIISYRHDNYIGIDERLSKGMISHHRLAAITEIPCQDKP